LNDADKWEIRVNIHNIDLVHANNSTVNNTGQNNDVQNWT
jgi:hypothetical protein